MPHCGVRGSNSAERVASLPPFLLLQLRGVASSPSSVSPPPPNQRFWPVEHRCGAFRAVPMTTGLLQAKRAAPSLGTLRNLNTSTPGPSISVDTGAPSMYVDVMTSTYNHPASLRWCVIGDVFGREMLIASFLLEDDATEYVRWRKGITMRVEQREADYEAGR